jgi:predicted nucleotidyltransferase
MANKTVVKSIQKYLLYLSKNGIPVSYGVLFGSYAKGKANKWSDIDLLVVSPKFDGKRTFEDYEKLWIYAGRSDYRIEPIPVGEKQFMEENANTIIIIARREGQIIPLAD